MKNKTINIIFALLVIFASSYFFMGSKSEKSVTLYYDNSLAANDTMITGLYDIGGARDVAIWTQVSDSVNARVIPVYTRGASGQRTVLENDSISNLNRNGQTPYTNGKDLRGYGAHNPGANGQDTNLIVGANLLGVKIVVTNVNSAGDAGANYVKVGLILSE